MNPPVRSPVLSSAWNALALAIREIKRPFPLT